jgi:ABC-2 type transport system permease protein
MYSSPSWKDTGQVIDVVKRFLIRIFAFVRKEIVNVIRQPRLVLTLVLGPFLILFIFGIGFRNEPQALRTLFAVEQDSPLRPYVEEYATTLGPQLVYAGMTEDLNAALRLLRNQEVDNVVHIPPDAAESIERQEQVVFTIYHNELNPTEAGYVEFAMNIYVDELNRRVLSELYRERQEQATEMRENVEEAQVLVSEARDALERDDIPATQRQLRELNRALEQYGVDAEAPPEDPTEPEEPDTAETLGDTTVLSQTLALLAGLSRDAGDLDEELDEPQIGETERYSATLGQMDRDLEELHNVLTAVEEVPAPVLLSPFLIETENVLPVELEMTDYYTPGVLALLLQHLAITFAGLSIVQENRLGALRLFQVAPVSPFEILVGKYLSYILLIGVIFLLLTLLVVFVLNVPMLGNWGPYALSMLLVTFASLSIGFLISLFSTSTSQAVQASMIMLLASVFFTGFFQSLDFLMPWVHVISWALPATYARVFLEQVMFRAAAMDPLLILGLVTLGGVLLAVNMIVLRTRMVRH